MIVLIECHLRATFFLERNHKLKRPRSKRYRCTCPIVMSHRSGHRDSYDDDSDGDDDENSPFYYAEDSAIALVEDEIEHFDFEEAYKRRTACCRVNDVCSLRLCCCICCVVLCCVFMLKLTYLLCVRCCSVVCCVMSAIVVLCLCFVAVDVFVVC